MFRSFRTKVSTLYSGDRQTTGAAMTLEDNCDAKR
jgi:hypothetical protein